MIENFGYNSTVGLTLIKKADVNKHAPGKHNQQSHAGGRGGGSDLGPIYDDLGLFMYDYDNANDKEKRKERDKLSTQQKGDWTAAERGAVEAYQGGGHYDINDSLRDTDGKFDVKSAAYALLIDDAMKKSKPLGRDITVYRGVKTSEAFDRQKEAKDFFNELEDGDEFSDLAFTSTTLDPRVAANFANLSSSPDEQGILFRINVPNSTTGIFMNSVSAKAGFNSEMEFLLPRGSKFKVLRKAGKVWDLEVIND